MPERRKMRVIPARKIKRGKHTVIEWVGEEGKPMFSNPDPGGVDWECGSCGALLYEGMNPGQVNAVVIKCKCGTYNDGTI